MSSIPEAKRNEIKVGAKLTVVKNRIKKVRDNRAMVMPEVTHILEIQEAMTEIFLEAEASIAKAFEDLTVKSHRLEHQINLLAKHLGNKSNTIEGDKQIVGD